MIEARQNDRLTLKLFTSFTDQIGGKGAIVLNFFEGAQPAFKAQILGQVDAAHSPLADDPAYLVPATQYFPSFERDGHGTVPIGWKIKASEDILFIGVRPLLTGPRKTSLHKKAILCYIIPDSRSRLFPLNMDICEEDGKDGAQF
jgi:hypothetical protein